MTTPIRIAIGVYLLVVGVLAGMTIDHMRYDVQRSEVLGQRPRAAVAPARVLLHALKADGLQIARQPGL